MSTESKIQQIATQGGLIFADIQTGSNCRFRAVGFSADDVNSTQASLRADRRYLIASITKPIVGMAVLRLASEGKLTLTDRIGSLLPQFSKAVYRRITVRHLLTHTSGFPDMLPNNKELRAAHASLDDFISESATIEPDFAAGTNCQYSSVGFLLLGAIIEQIATQSAASLLREIFFEPLNMKDSWLGFPNEQADALMPTALPCCLPIWQPDETDWGWNSRYWRTLGAPWGGMISTAADLGRFARMLISEGAAESGQQILTPNVVTAAFKNQIASMIGENQFTGNSRAWGYGWRKQWNAHHASFGDFVPCDAVGHWGASGTMMWIDPAVNRYAVFLTTTPYEQSQPVMQRMSNVVCST